MTAPHLPTLAAVVPVRDEVGAVEETLRRLRRAIDRSPWRGASIVVVDDGSRDGTAPLLEVLAEPLGLDVVVQDNQGRLPARRRGLQKANTELVLLVDARVRLDEDALAHVADEMRSDPSARLWNGHVRVDSHGNPYAGFWSALTQLGWRRYYASPTRTSYGLEDFDAYPKGTTLFLAPRQWLVQASRDLPSHYDVAHLASDDTALIRLLAGRARIHLSPSFSCSYRGREALAPFLRQAFYRGTTFVDGYLGRGGRVGRALGAVLVAAPVLLPLTVRAAVRRPTSVLVPVALGSASLGAAARRVGAGRADALALAGLSPLFSLVFGAGVVRGLLLAVRARARRSGRR